MRHLISSDDVTSEEQASVVRRALEMKRSRTNARRILQGSSVGLLFEKPSTRTRIAFEAAVVELGGHPIVLRAQDLQIERGETLEDTARVLSRYLAALVIRTFGQDRIDAVAEAATIPVVNALSDLEHPCQALADIMTISESFADLSKVKLVYLGDGNNVCHSLLLAGAKAGLRIVEVACPPGFAPIEPIIERAEAIGKETGTRIVISNDPFKAAKGARVLYTDVWTSMGQESEQGNRKNAFRKFALTQRLLEAAAPDAIAMHCLPAHRGEEIAAEVIDGPASVVWEQAANRLPVHKAVLEWLLSTGRKAG
jgi:ornithine carbamoyltransferase